jgi:hypothetical protein
LRPFFFVSKNAGVHYFQGIQGGKRAKNPLIAAVNNMVVGIEAQIETGFFQRSGVFVRRAELRIAFVWFAGQGYFQIDNRQICRTHLIFDVLKTGRIIVLTFMERRVDLGLMLHGVAGKKQSNGLRKDAICAA